MKEIIFLTACLAFAVLVRLLVISNNPQFVTGGDSGEYATLTKELINGNFVPPANNSLQYPGSQFVYPPALLEIFAAIYVVTTRISLTQADPLLIFHFQLFFSIGISALTGVPIYYLIKELFDTTAAKIGSLLWIIYVPALYTLTWSSYTSVWGLFLLTILFCLLTRIRRDFKTALMAGLILALIGLSHDLDALVAIATLIVYTVSLSISASTRPYSVRVLLSLVIGAVGMSFWYIPKAAYLIAIPKITSYQGTSIGALTQSMEVPWNSSTGWQVFFVVLCALAITASLTMSDWPYKDHHRSFFSLALIFAPILLLVLSAEALVLFSRLLYYVYFGTLILGPSALCYVIAKIHRLSARRTLISKNLIRALLIFLICISMVLSLPTILTSTQTAHSWYSYDPTYNHIIDTRALQWINSHLSSSNVVVVDGWEMGTWISAFNNNPVLIAQGPQWLTQQKERTESQLAYQIIENPASENAISYIDSNNVSYVIVPAGKSSNANLSELTFCFTQVYNDGLIAIFARHGLSVLTNGVLRISESVPTDVRFYVNGSFVGEWGVNWAPMQMGNYYLTTYPQLSISDANVTIVTPSTHISFSADLQTTPIPIMGNATTIVSINNFG
jgi:hypothetical protein